MRCNGWFLNDLYFNLRMSWWLLVTHFILWTFLSFTVLSLFRPVFMDSNIKFSHKCWEREKKKWLRCIVEYLVDTYSANRAISNGKDKQFNRNKSKELMKSPDSRTEQRQSTLTQFSMWMDTPF